jgi:hypothetical protein
MQDQVGVNRAIKTIRISQINEKTSKNDKKKLKQ